MGILGKFLDNFGLSWGGSYEEYYSNKENNSSSEGIPPIKKPENTSVNLGASETKIPVLINSRISKESLPRERQIKANQAIEEKMTNYCRMPYQICNCSYIGEGTAWTGYNWNNRRTLELAINQINYFLEETKNLDDVVSKAIPSDYHINFREIQFDEPYSSYGLPRSYILYCPEGKNKKRPKFPLIAFFNTSAGNLSFDDEFYIGELYYAVNGDLSRAVIQCHKHGKFAEYTLSVIGHTFLISKIKTVGANGKIFTLYDCMWELTNYIDFA